MNTPTPEIRQALYRHLLCALPIGPVQQADVAWPNSPFKPDVSRVYIAPACLYGTTEEACLSRVGFEILNGVFQITIYGVLYTGEAVIEQVARELTDLFRAGTRLTLPDDRELLLIRSYRNSLYIQTGGSDMGGQINRPSVTVSANWRHFVSRGE